MKVGRYADKFRWQDTQVMKSKVFCGSSLCGKGKAHHLSMASEMDNSEPMTKVLFCLWGWVCTMWFSVTGTEKLDAQL